VTFSTSKKLENNNLVQAYRVPDSVWFDQVQIMDVHELICPFVAGPYYHQVTQKNFLREISRKHKPNMDTVTQA